MNGTDSTSLETALRQTIDPFGIMTSCMAVQRAWLQHPAELTEQMQQLGRDLLDVQLHMTKCACGLQSGDCIPPKHYDERFQEPIWQESPFYDALKEHYLLYTHWLEDAIFQTPDTDDKTARRAAFWVRQWLDAISPTNFFWTNPLAVWTSLTSGGHSLIHGTAHLLEDAAKGDISMVGKDAFQVGEDLATTPGTVVFRNELLELIQYKPATEQVHSVPILIVAPWINKYYILDLKPHKSLINHLVSQGFTVFITSWKNPDAGMCDTTFEDYMLRGVLPAVEAARAITDSQQIHAVGYCIGGTLLSILMAWMNRAETESEQPVGSWTLLTGMVDFSDPGDIDVFIDEYSIDYLEQRMATTGYLDGEDMARSFRVLRPNSLIWRYVANNYLYGEEPPPFDVLYWNTDCTRLPAAMHSFYLREFYVENNLVKADALTMGGRPIDLGRISQPLYAVGTEQDHIAPWKETFKICSQVSGPVRYTLATSGHILGIISPPVDPPKRRYWTGEATGQTYPESWRNGIDKIPGSWWEDWVNWLDDQCGELVSPPPLGNKTYPALEDAPGTYVLEK
ncbi:MAG: class I poly(R)-hydroxyalkanoic acid synthase [Gammaproteobacteria bacterium]|nr:class I poly(R)-hydroxyalkanoic acid synthase [Gammaproteobacteria bacterium]